MFIQMQRVWELNLSLYISLVNLEPVQVCSFVATRVWRVYYLDFLSSGNYIKG